MRKILLLCCSLFLLNACQQDDENEALSIDHLASVRWQLVSAETLTIPSRKEFIPFIEFVEGNKVSGFSGCNRFQGHVEIKGNNVRFTPLAMSKRYCMETAKVETLFVEALAQVASGQINGNTLNFYNEEGDYLLTFFGQAR